jgi:hypothetical protein
VFCQSVCLFAVPKMIGLVVGLAVCLTVVETLTL